MSLTDRVTDAVADCDELAAQTDVVIWLQPQCCVLKSPPGPRSTIRQKGVYLNDIPGADIVFDNPEFRFDLAEKYTMTLFTENGEVMSLDLTGSYKALEAAMECQEEMG